MTQSKGTTLAGLAALRIRLRDQQKAAGPSWAAIARPDQLPPVDDGWRTWLILAGRRWGKTRVGAETIVEWDRLGQVHSTAAIGQTAADARDVLLFALRNEITGRRPDGTPTFRERPGTSYEPSKLLLHLANGASVRFFSAEDPDSLRGYGFDSAWCVAAGAEVETRRGPVRIELIQAGDEVLTRRGWRHVTAARQTGRDRETMTVTTAAGEIRCTPDHRLWVEGQGWQPAETIRPGDILLACSNTDRPHGSTGRESGGATTIGSVDTWRPESSWPVLFGRIPTALFQMGTRFITAITTVPMIALRTLSYFPSGIIGTFMEPSTAPRLGPRPPGSAQWPYGPTGSRPHTNVDGAGLRSRVGPRPCSSVVQPTVQPTVVVSVEGHSGWSDVYDLTVAGAHEFFAGGILVHNCDELAAWRFPETYDQLQFGLSLGQARQIVTTTPRPTKIIRDLILDSSTRVTRGRTLDNAANLDAAAVAYLTGRYANTRMGRQELEGEVLEDVLGALWSGDMIHYRPAPTILRNGEVQLDLARVAVAVDPNTTESEEADECGITVHGLAYDGTGYLLADRSVASGPREWAPRAVQAAYDYQADEIIIESNQGGDMARMTIEAVIADRLRRGTGRSLPVRTVNASRGKRTRAEPIAQLYEQKRIFHTKPFPELEEQLTHWTPEGGESPDRLDALVWGWTFLMANPKMDGWQTGTYGSSIV